MKLLILAAGKGTRLGMEGSKCLVGRRPVIYNSLDLSFINPVNGIVIVVGHACDDVINMVGTRYGGLDVRYVMQREQKGIIDAIRTAKLDDDFILTLGDEYIHKPKPITITGDMGTIGVVKGATEEIKKTYSVDTDGEYLVSAEEKPLDPKGDLIGTGYCFFHRESLNFLRSVKDGQLVTWLLLMIEMGNRIHVANVGERYININTGEELGKYNNCL